MTSVAPDSLGYTIEVADVISETPDASSLIFDVPKALVEKFTYRPGQFLTVRIPSERTGSVARCYSLASSPTTDERLKVTVKRTAGGYGSNWLCDNITAGDSLHVLPPSGTFTPHDLNGDFQLFAAGSGITPVMSILKTVLASAAGSVALYYANRDRESIIFDSELADLAKKYPDRLTIEHRIESETGLPTPGSLTQFADNHFDSNVFVCGPAPFMALVKETLTSIGYDRHHIHIEEFRSLDGDPFAPIKVVVTDEDTESSTVEVTLDGDTHTLPWPADATLIDVMVSAGIDAPYSCREGECGSCACTLVEGTVDPGNTDALDPDDVADGYILGCQAKPTSPNLKIEF
ncbi:ferredoxin--NADP reductase [Rhodococcus pyridinivorans]|uniref:ferredoxin--NADP reductase n=1 Tax=Rhodococcus pyridinivorans TaxID=103816 RepID=UPI0022841209|nr:ferredoxin--NADP reductase [Rhodococcus pyridinivorans]WAL49333.1 ferredoxin--NADP reductase [Rhodococcus pyridinivorans]